MGEIFRSTVYARGLRPAPLALAAALAAVAAVLGWADGRLNPPTLLLLSSVAAVVMSAGLVGNDVADGTVQLVLARPITRNEYLAGRLLGAVALALAVGALFLAADLAGALVSPAQDLPRPGFTPRPRFEAGELWGVALTLGAHLLWQTALCFALSTVAPGRGDVVSYVALLLSSVMLAGQAADLAWPWLASALHWWAEQVQNRLRYSGPSLVFAKDLARWASNAALVILVGAALFRRREFSYGAG
jgi:ABC-type Na+ efflux pump permease subunit